MKCSNVFILTMAVLLVGGVAASQDVPDPLYVYTSDPSVGQITQIDVATGDSFLVFDDPDLAIEDVVFGPDGYLYACAPNDQTIIRFIPEVIEEPVECWEDCYYPCTGECPDMCVQECEGSTDPDCYSGCMATCEIDCGYACEGLPYCDDAGIQTVSEDVEYVFNSYSGVDLDPQCGSFTHAGDLIFTDTSGDGLWMCRDLAFGSASGGEEDDPLCVFDAPEAADFPGELAPVPASGFGFWGQGTTQTAGGDALAVENDDGYGTVLRFEMDKPTGAFVDEPPTTLIGEDLLELELVNPRGIARLSTGDIFVAARFDIEIPEGDAIVTVSGVQRFTPLRDPETGQKYWRNTCNQTLGEYPAHGTPFFLEATADDTVYVGSVDEVFGAEIWAITVDDYMGDYDLIYDCDAQPVFPSGGTGPVPALIYGVALTPTWTPPSEIDQDEDGDVFISFNDHVYELGLPDQCGLFEDTVMAQEVPIACLNNLIAEYVNDPDFPNEFDAYPVTYLGEEGFGMAYNLEGDCGEGGPGEATDDEIIHAISAFTETINNPRILKCNVVYQDPVEDGILVDVCDPPSNYRCEVLDLDSFFPGAGVLPDDGRIGSRSSASFSQYFVVQSGPFGYEPISNPATPGDNCGGFWWPFRGIEELDCIHCGPPKYLAGWPVWARFRAVPEDGNCWRGPFITDTDFLASVARVRDADGNHVFQQMELDTIVSGDDPSWFKPPHHWWPRQPYRILFRTNGWEPGMYQIVAQDLKGGVPVFYDYFEIVEWCAVGDDSCFGGDTFDQQ